MFRRLLHRQPRNGRLYRTKGFLIKTAELQIRCRGTGACGTKIVSRLIKRLETVPPAALEWITLNFDVDHGQPPSRLTPSAHHAKDALQYLEIEIMERPCRTTRLLSLRAHIHMATGSQLSRKSWQQASGPSGEGNSVLIMAPPSGPRRNSPGVDEFSEALAQLLEGLCAVEQSLMPIQQQDLLAFLASPSGALPAERMRRAYEIRLSSWSGPGAALADRLSLPPPPPSAGGRAGALLFVRGGPDLKLAEVRHCAAGALRNPGHSYPQTLVEVRFDHAMQAGRRTLITFMRHALTLRVRHRRSCCSAQPG